VVGWQLFVLVDAMTRRPRRSWTKEDKLIADAGIACGMSYWAIGQLLGRSANAVGIYLDPRLAEENRKRSQSWRNSNPGKDAERSRIWRRLNPEKAQKSSLCWRISNPDKIKRQDALKRASRKKALLPLNQQQIDTRFALWRNRCAFCGVNSGHSRNHGHKRLTEDHVLALSKYGLDEVDNIMPACDTCNKSKGASPVEAWYRKQPFFTEARWRKICRHCPGAVIGQLPLAMPPSDTEAA
jgi:5-methylcytosine-specific restriction endonuclease McrA